ncbi:hypothetical protein K7N18_34435 [Burkholderia arboris]|uniref:hypothetical protein n=1 Tax=Burkholderia arboris TaxID=488730 RepID=UPI001CA3F886|nr:hypothetical protein [Burkholderia arboris]MBY8609920.1 hypothetical protein [Burkholderia arboris]
MTQKVAMKQPTSGLKARVLRWFAIETRGCVLGFLGGGVGALLAFTYLNYHYKGAGPVQGDPVSIANTYIVFTTFVITGVAVMLAVAGLIFTQHFSMEKEAHVEHAFGSLIQQIKAGDDKVIKLVEELMKNPDVVQYVSFHLNSKLEEMLETRLDDAGRRASDAQNEVSTLTKLRAGVSPGNNGQQGGLNG